MHTKNKWPTEHNQIVSYSSVKLLSNMHATLLDLLKDRTDTEHLFPAVCDEWFLQQCSRQQGSSRLLTLTPGWQGCYHSTEDPSRPAIFSQPNTLWKATVLSQTCVKNIFGRLWRWVAFHNIDTWPLVGIQPWLVPEAWVNIQLAPYSAAPQGRLTTAVERPDFNFTSDLCGRQQRQFSSRHTLITLLSLVPQKHARMHRNPSNLT